MQLTINHSKFETEQGQISQVETVADEPASLDEGMQIGV